MTFKDKFTKIFNPFRLKNKIKMVEAWGWTHFSGVYLKVFPLFLMVLRRTFVFFIVATRRSKISPNLFLKGTA